MEYPYSRSIQAFGTSAVREILKLTQNPAVISFAGGLPAEEFFPVEAVREAFGRVFDAGPRVLQYGLTEGFLPLRERLSNRLCRDGLTATPGNLLLGTGSQQIIDLLGRVLLDPGDTILVQRPTYLAALQAFGAYRARPVAVEGDTHGMDPDALRSRILAERPKFVYVCPAFSNPTGHTWSLERREALLDVCTEFEVLVIEDDPYGELYYDAAGRVPTIYALAAKRTGGVPEVVVYTSTFSKVVAPALRTGWALGDSRLLARLAQAKQAADLHSSSLDQQALAQLLAHFDLDTHLDTIRREYGRRMEVMAGLLESEAGQFAFERPLGGMFLWARLPKVADTGALLKLAVQEGVAFVPGAPFYPGDPDTSTMRLNFTNAQPETIALGVTRLRRAMASIG